MLNCFLEFSKSLISLSLFSNISTATILWPLNTIWDGTSPKSPKLIFCETVDDNTLSSAVVGFSRAVSLSVEAGKGLVLEGDLAALLLLVWPQALPMFMLAAGRGCGVELDKELVHRADFRLVIWTWELRIVKDDPFGATMVFTMCDDGALVIFACPPVVLFVLGNSCLVSIVVLLAVEFSRILRRRSHKTF